VVGTDLDSGRQRVVTAGGFRVVELSDNGADFSLPLSAGAIGLPHMSGRVYFSLGDKLAFPVVADGAGNPAPQHPAGWVEFDASFGVLYDVVEFTFNDAGMFCNGSPPTPGPSPAVRPGAVWSSTTARRRWPGPAPATTCSATAPWPRPTTG
jgi:hypothetical protein